MADTMQNRWLDHLRVWQVDQKRALAAFETIRTHYADPGRFYHTLDHIADVLNTVEHLAPHAIHPHAIRLAAWLHDVVYDSRAADNEERSAEFARTLCDELSIPEGERVATLIRRTKTHDPEGDRDSEVLLDADLAILGSDEATYRTYAERIRREYGWVADADYRNGRRKVLTRFLARPRIFHLLHDLEAPARKNISVEIERLAAI